MEAQKFETATKLHSRIKAYESLESLLKSGGFNKIKEDETFWPFIRKDTEEGELFKNAMLEIVAKRIEENKKQFEAL